MKNMRELIEEWRDHNHAHCMEGPSGLDKLNKLCEAIGYKQEPFGQESPIECFLQDNSGAIEAIIKWIGKEKCDEWRKNLDSALPEKEYETFDEEQTECPECGYRSFQPEHAMLIATRSMYDENRTLRTCIMCKYEWLEKD